MPSCFTRKQGWKTLFASAAAEDRGWCAHVHAQLLCVPLGRETFATFEPLVRKLLCLVARGTISYCRPGKNWIIIRHL